jgi:hemerythrin-like domain-containing protein
MKPIGPLMWEHRLIERMVGLISGELERISAINGANVEFLIAAVDFFRTYADRTHHGKEESILFRELARKPLSEEHNRVMNELIEEHVFGRKLVAELAETVEQHRRSNTNAVRNVETCLQKLIAFYPAHIEKEDKHFFYPCLEYLSRQEQDSMLQEFWEFDRKMIHERYQKAVGDMEKLRNQSPPRNRMSDR